MANFRNSFSNFDEEGDAETPFCMHNVFFALQTSDYSTIKLYKLTDYSQKVLSK